MGKYEIDLFNHNLSVDPEFRAGILASDEKAWRSVPLTADERSALESVDIAWLLSLIHIYSGLLHRQRL